MEEIKVFVVVYRYKTRPRFKSGRWKVAEKSFGARDLAEALRLAKEYAEATYRGQWVVDVCSEVKRESVA